MTPICVQPRGRGRHRRYVLKRGGEFWNGEGWSKEVKKAQLSYDRSDAARIAQELETEAVPAGSRQYFTVPLRISLHAECPMGIEELTEWLRKAISLNLTAEEDGAGPIRGSVVRSHIDWNDLKPV
jgi:hypothetical protein